MICWFWRPFEPGDVNFLGFFLLLLTHGSWSKTLNYPKICAHPMDRPEVLHTARYDIELSWKNTTSDFKLVLRWEILTFPPKRYIYVWPWLPLNMPTAGKNITLQGASRLYESLLSLLGGRFASANVICSFWRPFEPGDVIFLRFFDYCWLTAHGPKPWPRWNSALILWIELRFCMKLSMMSLSWKNTNNDFKLVLRWENLTFRSEKYIFVPPWLPLNMPTAV